MKLCPCSLKPSTPSVLTKAKPHDKGHIYGRFQLVKLGVQLRHVKLQYNLVLFKSQRQAVIQGRPALLSSGEGYGSLCWHSVVVPG